MNKREIIALSKALLKDREQVAAVIEKHEELEESYTEKLNALASLHCKISAGDEVEHKPEGFGRSVHGIVHSVEWGSGKNFAVVHVRPFAKQKKRRLLRGWNQVRTFITPSLLTVIASGDKVAPYER